MTPTPNPSHPDNEPIKSLDRLMADLLRENERLRRQAADTVRERDEYKKLYLIELARNDVPPTQADLDTAVPARPLIEAMIRRLEQP